MAPSLNLHRDDVRLLVVALELAASRRESMVRAGVGLIRGRNHKAEADRMRFIRSCLLRALVNSRSRDFTLTQGDQGNV